MTENKDQTIDGSVQVAGAVAAPVASPPPLPLAAVLTRVSGGAKPVRIQQREKEAVAEWVEALQADFIREPTAADLSNLGAAARLLTLEWRIFRKLLDDGLVMQGSPSGVAGRPRAQAAHPLLSQLTQVSRLRADLLARLPLRNRDNANVDIKALWSGGSDVEADVVAQAPAGGDADAQETPTERAALDALRGRVAPSGVPHAR